MANGTCDPFSIGRNGSLGMWAPVLLGGPSSLRCHCRNSTERGGCLACSRASCSLWPRSPPLFLGPLLMGHMPPLLRWFCTSVRPNPPALRGTDVWLSRGSSYAVQRVLCWAMGVSVTDCGLTGRGKGKDQAVTLLILHFL